MSWSIYDPDEWYPIGEYIDHGIDAFGYRIVSFSYIQRRRSPDEVAKIKADKQRKHEDEILREAAEIRRRRFEILREAAERSRPPAATRLALQGVVIVSPALRAGLV